MLFHRANGLGNNPELRPFFPGMHEADCLAHGIDDEDRATIGDVNAEAHASSIGDQAVTTFKAGAINGGGIDNSNAVAVHLLRGHERHAFEPMFFSDFAMISVQPRQRFHLVA